MVKRQEKAKRAKQHLVTHILAWLLLVVGATIALYPFYVGALNDLVDRYHLNQIEQVNQRRSTANLNKMNQENDKLKQTGMNANADPFAGMSKSKEANMKKEMLGNVTVPKLKLTVPLFKTLTDETLEVGAAVIHGTSMPTGGPSTHTVIAGHRGLTNRRLFSDLNRVKKGDTFVLKVYGKHLAYKVYKIQTVLPENTTILKIESGKDLATLLTCTPYMINSHRLLITGKRVPYTKAIAKSVSSAQRDENWQQLAILIGSIAAIFLLIGLMVRHIYMLLLKKRRFDLIFYRFDTKGVPIQATYNLYRGRSKRPLYRDGNPLEAVSQHDGSVKIDNLPGGVYRLREVKPMTNITVKVGVKRLKQVKMAFYPRKKQRDSIFEQNGDWWIQH